MLRQFFRASRPKPRRRNRDARRVSTEPLEERVMLSADFTLDLTTVGAEGFVGQAFFQQIDPQSTGTGVINSFLRLQDTNAGDRIKDGDEEGFNTDFRPTPLDEKSDPNFTHSLRLNDLPIVKLNGGPGPKISYFQFLLDINENRPDTYITLDQLQLYVTNGVNPDIETLAELQSQTKIFDLDDAALGGGATDSNVVLNYFLNHGSGSGDMFAYIPTSLFDDVNGNPNVYLYSRFGECGTATIDIDGESVVVDTRADAGFEEWSLLESKKGNGGPGPQPELTLEAFKFEDINGDGDYAAGENPLNGWTIEVYQDNGNGTFGNEDDLIEPTLNTGHAAARPGVVSYTELEPGIYFVQEVNQNGWLQTAPAGNLFTVMLNTNLIVEFDEGGNSVGNSDLFFGNFDLFDISGTKFEDANGDGDLTGDSPLTDTPFTINLYEWTDADDEGDVDPGELVLADSTETDGSGNYAFNNLTPLPDGTKYYVQEAGEDGWLQTFGTDGYIVDPTSGNDSPDLDFGNFQLISISGYKWNDKNIDGIWDDGEPGIGGWLIHLDLGADGTIDITVATSDGTTDANGDSVIDEKDLGYYEFTDIGPGTYKITEEMPANSVNTYDGSLTFTAMSGQNQSGDFETTEPLNFGNILLGAGGGHTPGFWHNNNGFEAMNDGGTIQPELDLLAGLPLVDADGNDFDPVDHDDLSDYLTFESNANNMANQLSRHLAAMVLNVEAGFVDGNALVYAPGVGNTGTNNDFITINDLIALSIAALEADSYTPEGHPNRAYQALLKDALAAANENRSFVVC